MRAILSSLLGKTLVGGVFKLTHCVSTLPVEMAHFLLPTVLPPLGQAWSDDRLPTGWLLDPNTFVEIPTVSSRQPRAALTMATGWSPTVGVLFWCVVRIHLLLIPDMAIKAIITLETIAFSPMLTNLL